ncbi:uncharacterized protein OCT59_005827 [Rhizophagus irregularis]|uniref:uncharacterized protein n=1 Tax=Rhizophagus irregularis TaxID=588596 RepID=UPI00331910CB|nr:hypothetical protein OCT59_005827 [Rhizophagus irregularis]
MDEIKLSDDVIEQIKDFKNKYRHLTEEQKSLIDKLITDKELKERYKKYGLCHDCSQPETGSFYCQSCNSPRFKQNFKNWTSGNHDVDEFIQKAQLKAKDWKHIIEWIEYDKFEDVEYLAKGGFGTTFKAVWKDGPIWDYDNDQWKRAAKTKVALKCLYNSQDITADFLKEVESNILVYKTKYIVRCMGITKDTETNNFMMVMELKNGSLRQHLNNNFFSLNWKQKNNANSVIYGQVKKTDEINKKLSFSLPLISSDTSISYVTHPQAVYTSKLLDFKNLPEPKNADDNDNLLGIEYSDSLIMDFTKLNINSKDEASFC